MMDKKYKYIFEIIFFGSVYIKILRLLIYSELLYLLQVPVTVYLMSAAFSMWAFCFISLICLFTIIVILVHLQGFLMILSILLSVLSIFTDLLSDLE